jgi:hypothetical protein
MQTQREIVKTFFPMAKVTFHPGGSGADSICIGSPRLDIKGFDVHSKCFPLGTLEDLVWANAYWHLIERAQILLKGIEVVPGT